MIARLEGATSRRPSVLPNMEGACVHLIGVGGSGMSGAAYLLLGLGARVSGSDLTAFPGLGDLIARGARIHIGHDDTYLGPEVTHVVRSAAVPDSNPELAAAKGRGLVVWRYAEFLGALMSARLGVAVAGTHGKSTTTAMTTHVFRAAGLDPSFIVGARSAQLGGSSGLGRGPHMIVEACEFDRSFLHFWPESAAILNIEPDHLDCYLHFEAIVDAFKQFAGQVEPGGRLICNADDRWALEAAQSATAAVETFGFSDSADWRAVRLRPTDAGYAFSVEYRGVRMLRTSLLILGRHNVANALAAIALAHHAGAGPEVVANAVASFRGVDRRLSWRGQGRGVTIVDDYAHHPTEVKVSLEAARVRYRPKRLWVVFQPHQCARTRDFMDAFADSFGLADEVIVHDVYGARESDEQACRRGAEELVARISRTGRRAQYMPTFEAATGHLLQHFCEGDLVLTMGAGDVWKIADELVARIREPNTD